MKNIYILAAVAMFCLGAENAIAEESFAVPGDLGNMGTVNVDGTINNYTVDGGVIPFPGNSSIGDRIWLDINGNGIQDEGEHGIPDIDVTLYIKIGGSFVKFKETSTDQDGIYIFSDLGAGTYGVAVDIGGDEKEGDKKWKPTIWHAQGSDHTNDSDLK